MGINRKAARAVVLGKSQHGGLGLDHLATVHLYGQLQYLLGIIRCNDTTGQLARMMLEFAKLECGCIGDVLEQDYERYHGTIIDKIWITEIWSHLQLYDAKIQINRLWTPKPGSEGDTSIMERIKAPGIFTTRELQDINTCRLYLQVFFISDITDHSGHNIEDWVKQGHKQNSNIKWEWPVQQIPTSRKAWKQAVDEVLSCDGALTQHIGQWYREHHRQQQWYLYCGARTLWQCDGGKWFQHAPLTFGRLRFEPVGQEAERHASTQLLHVAVTSIQRRYITITDNTSIIDITPASIVPLVQYHSSLGECFFALPRHVQRLVGNIPPTQLPNAWDATTPVDIIITIYGSLMFGVGYHIWILALNNEEIITSGNGPGDGASAYMIISYRSDLGGIMAGLAAIGMLHRSGLICLRHIKFVCDKSASIIAAKRTVIQSIFHRLESDYNMISTMKFPQGNWCKDYEITYEWVKGHADRVNEEPNKEERLNIEVDALCAVIRNEVT
jgi:hypothetical protein